MIYSRTPTSTAAALALDTVKDHLRIDHGFDDLALSLMISATVQDFENQCDIALLPTLIKARSDINPGTDLALPVGPVAESASITVQALAEDGALSTITSYWLEDGRWPVLHLTDTPAHRVRVSYQAALATTPAGIPADILMALADQVARLYVQRGGIDDKAPALSAHMARVIARYRRPTL
ncbi:MAG: phage head-tail connector protein [Pseudomonadota bacterium]